MEVPKELVPAIRELIAKQRMRASRTSRSRRRRKARLSAKTLGGQRAD